MGPKKYVFSLQKPSWKGKGVFSKTSVLLRENTVFEDSAGPKTEKNEPRAQYNVRSIFYRTFK